MNDGERTRDDRLWIIDGDGDGEDAYMVAIMILIEVFINDHRRRHHPLCIIYHPAYIIYHPAYIIIQVAIIAISTIIVCYCPPWGDFFFCTVDFKKENASSLSFIWGGGLSLIHI